MRAKKNFRWLLLNLLAVGFLLLYSLLAFQTQVAAGSIAPFLRPADGTAALFLPIIRQGGSQPLVNEPRLPDSYPSEQNDPPPLPEAPQTGACQSLIRFVNYTNYPIYVYWNRPDETDVFYKSLGAGRHYWQHTYWGNRWNIRDEQGRLIKSITATRCDNTFIDIYIGDLPACGRITSVALWDLTTDRPVPGYEAMTNGMVIPFERLRNANLRVSVQEVVESIKFDLNDATLISNVGPYSYPAPQQAWEPEAGVYTLVVEAYRQNDAQSALCDQRRLTLQVGDSTTPIATLTPTATISVTNTPTATVSPTPTPSATAPITPTTTSTPTATPSSTPSPTLTPTLTPTFCSGRITDLRLLNLATGQVIAAYNPLYDGAVIDLAALPERFNLDVGVSGLLESVTIQVNDDLIMENFAPYRYPGGDIVPWRPTPGTYTIRTVAYSEDNATGFLCDVKLLYVTFVNNPPTPTPTPTATNTPPPPLAANCIGDWAWRDSNANGLQDGGEQGLAGLPVYIGQDSDNNGRLDRILASTTTDGGGRYAFCALIPATYLIEFGAVDGCINTIDNQGSNDALDSDASVGFGISPPVILTAGSANSTIDAGFICN
ncbi:MAG: hypothetical protein DYG89_22635 [Caldilinea sp. CFX5]|nr:hypothetical protein [Caldilinea sp. CFX5]